jgi:branched-chain amino acid aminotransferase
MAVELPDELAALSIWRDGELLGPERAALSVWDHGVLYGDGVFEGLRLRDGWLYRPELHLERLMRSGRIIGLEPVYDDAAILSAVATLAQANRLTDAHVRLLWTRGAGLPGLDPRRCPRTSLTILAYPFPPLLGTEPIALITSSIVRKSPRSVDAAAKTMNYLDGILAKIQANAAGANDALMLNGSGYVAEATGANLFVVTGGLLRTPPTTAALPGITRATVLELAATRGIRRAVEQLTVGDVYVAEEAFLTGTAAGIVPVAQLDGRPLREVPGPTTKLLQDAYAATWNDPAYSKEIADLARANVDGGGRPSRGRHRAPRPPAVAPLPGCSDLRTGGDLRLRAGRQSRPPPTSARRPARIGTRLYRSRTLRRRLLRRAHGNGRAQPRPRRSPHRWLRPRQRAARRARVPGLPRRDGTVGTGSSRRC